MNGSGPRQLRCIVCAVFLLFTLVAGFTKVVVPSVFKEWQNGPNGTFNPPQWASNATVMAVHNYTVHLYQKLNASASNYISTNRGRENGVFYRYIVDHFDDFPDVAVFTHADPAEHQPKFLHWIKCISPNASYLSINNHRYYRKTDYWHKYELWIEQCFRDVLKVVWNVNGTQEMARLLPLDRPISVSFYCCQQFLISREMIHRRPLSVWKKLLRILGEADVCHNGEPEYETLHSYHKKNVKVGPEPSLLPDTEDTRAPGTGRLTQAVTSEHLAHVIFGHHDLDMEWPSEKVVCQNFLPRSQCPGSPCVW